jgi:oligopeptidase B
LSILDRVFFANIRGGEDLGRQWYEDGKLLKREKLLRIFDCSKFLINEKFTSPEHLYAEGGSAGGRNGSSSQYGTRLYNG